MQALQNLQERGKDDFDNNRLLRRIFKKRKIEEEAIEAEKNKIKNFALPLTDLTEREVGDIQQMKLNINNLHNTSKVAREKVLTGSILTKNVQS
jgi:hypothetical protein